MGTDEESRPSIWEALGGLRSLLAGERWTLGGVVALSIPTGFVEAAVVALVAETAVTMAGGSSELVLNFGPLVVRMSVTRALVLGFVLALARLALRLGSAYLPARLVANVQARLRTGVFDDYAQARWAVQAQERDGHLQEIMTTQINRIAKLLRLFTNGLGAVLVFAGLATSAFFVDPVAATVMLVVGVGLFGLFRPLATVARGESTSASGASVDFAAAVNEAVRVGEEHWVFDTSDAQSAEVAERVEEVRRPFLRAQFAGRAAGEGYKGLVFVLLILGLATFQVAGVSDLGSVGATVLILLRSLAYGQQAQDAYTVAHDHLPYLERTLQARNQYRRAAETTGQEALSMIDELAFEAVSYAYPADQQALSQVSFQVNRGEAVGVIGPSGAGKSTLVQILLRLRRPDSGLYTVNRAEAWGYDRSDWARLVTYVPQEPRLIHASVAENIRFHRDGISDAAVEQAARAAHIHEDVTSWSGGYGRLVGQRADAVSGGQRQRLCLARALVTDPELLVLDEPTSALDPRSERLIQQTLQELHDRGVTLVIIAHRSVTLELIDAVLILDEGRLVEFGPPDEVAMTGGDLVTDLLDASGAVVSEQRS